MERTKAVTGDICANCGEARTAHVFGRGGAKCAISGRPFRLSPERAAEVAHKALFGPGSPEEAKAQGACFYSLPSEVRPEEIDPLLREIVGDINRSGWVWTGESCQGHPDATRIGDTSWGHNTEPYLRIITHKANTARLLVHLIYALDVPGDDMDRAIEGLWDMYPAMRIYRDDRDSYDEFKVYLPATTAGQRNGGIEVFRRFAKAVNE